MSSLRFTLSDLPPAMQAEYFAKYGPRQATPAGSVVPETPVDTGKKRIRQVGDTVLNATEQRFFDYLKALHPSSDVGSQRLRFRLAKGAWYKPDNDVIADGEPLTCYEVKGFLRPKDALTLKVVAQQFPRVRFVLVTERDGGGWDYQNVLA